MGARKRHGKGGQGQEKQGKPRKRNKKAQKTSEGETVLDFTDSDISDTELPADIKSYPTDEKHVKPKRIATSEPSSKKSRTCCRCCVISLLLIMVLGAGAGGYIYYFTDIQLSDVQEQIYVVQKRAVGVSLDIQQKVMTLIAGDKDEPPREPVSEQSMSHGGKMDDISDTLMESQLDESLESEKPTHDTKETLESHSDEQSTEPFSDENLSGAVEEDVLSETQAELYEEPHEHEELQPAEDTFDEQLEETQFESKNVDFDSELPEEKPLAEEEIVRDDFSQQDKVGELFEDAKSKMNGQAEDFLQDSTQEAETMPESTDTDNINLDNILTDDCQEVDCGKDDGQTDETDLFDGMPEESPEDELHMDEEGPEDETQVKSESSPVDEMVDIEETNVDKGSLIDERKVDEESYVDEKEVDVVETEMGTEHPESEMKLDVDETQMGVEHPEYEIKLDQESPLDETQEVKENMVDEIQVDNESPADETQVDAKSPLDETHLGGSQADDCVAPDCDLEEDEIDFQDDPFDTDFEVELEELVPSELQDLPVPSAEVPVETDQEVERTFEENQLDEEIIPRQQTSEYIDEADDSLSDNILDEQMQEDKNYDSGIEDDFDAPAESHQEDVYSEDEVKKDYEEPVDSFEEAQGETKVVRDDITPEELAEIVDAFKHEEPVKSQDEVPSDDFEFDGNDNLEDENFDEPLLDDIEEEGVTTEEENVESVIEQIPEKPTESSQQKEIFEGVPAGEQKDEHDSQDGQEADPLFSEFDQEDDKDQYNAEGDTDFSEFDTNGNGLSKQPKTEYANAAITSAEDYEIREKLDEADDLVEKRRPREASGIYSELLRMYPFSPRALHGRAYALDVQSEIDQSNPLLEEAIQAYERVFDAKDIPYELAKKSAKRGAERMTFRGWAGRGARHLGHLVELFPDDHLLWNDVGVQYLMAGKSDQARLAFQKVMEKEPTNPFAMVHLGFILKTTDNKPAEAIPYLQSGIDSEAAGTVDGRFYHHLGDAYARTGQVDKAHAVYRKGAHLKLFPSFWQRSLYNVEGLAARPWWTLEQTGQAHYFKMLEDNWETIRDEALANMDASGTFKPEEENLRETGDWKQFTLYAQGRKNSAACAKAPKTCALLDSFTEATGCKRGQIKFSIMQPGVHVWPHCGPTNCRVRAHLGLVVPDAVRIRVTDETRTWHEGKVIVFDDSFEHEVWHQGDSFRLVLIVDIWHPDLTQRQKMMLSPI